MLRAVNCVVSYVEPDNSVMTTGGFMRRLFILIVLMLCGISSAQTYVQLILDASGSMWNRLSDGEYRIVAAKNVLSSFISSLPADPDLNVGLRIYGSQIDALQPGSCEDSQLFVPMSGINRDTLLTTVRDTRARGATPIAYSLEQAAQDFPASGRKVIILVTDGEESCGGDVRGVLESLQAQGIEIELKIIGFDLDARAVASFEGLGDFENTTSAAELAEALGRTIEVEQIVRYLVTAQVTRDGAPAEDGVRVIFSDTVSGDSYTLTATDTGTLSAELPAGAYSATVEDAFSDEPQVFSGLTVTPDTENSYSFELATETEVTLTVTPTDPLTGSRVTVAFEGAPANPSNWITVVPTDLPDDSWLDFTYAGDSGGAVEVQLPGEATTLEARFHLALPEGGSRVIGRSAPFTPVQASATLSFPESVPAGTTFEVSWTGPNNSGDYLTVVPADAEVGFWREYRYTSTGNPLTFTAPMAAGDYEVRYQSDGSTGLIARAPLTVVASEVSLNVPAEVAAGTAFEVSWAGPDGSGDYLTVVPIDLEDGAYREYRYTRDGNPLTFTAPIEAGNYEVRYQSDRESGVFARAAFTVTATDISLSAPASVMAGAPFEVSWVGPDGNSDYLTIVPADAAPGTYAYYRYTREGSPLTLVAGIEPGQYEVRYQSDRESGIVFASTPITITPVQVSLSAPSEVGVGATFEVSWSGPNGPSDYITIVPASAEDGTYGDYRYTNSGSTVSLRAPDTAGQYEIRYQSDRVQSVFARIPITVR